MTLENAGAELAKAVSGPQPPPGKDRWHHLQYIPVQGDASFHLALIDAATIFTRGVLGQQFGGL